MRDWNKRRIKIDGNLLSLLTLLVYYKCLFYFIVYNNMLNMYILHIYIEISVYQNKYLEKKGECVRISISLEF